jgi:hypothetical protein
VVKRSAVGLALLICVGCDAGPESYPFIGKWELEKKSGEQAFVCDFMPSMAISRKHVITPLVFANIESAKRDGKRWIVVVRDQHQPGPPILLTDVSSSKMKIVEQHGKMECAMRKVGECTDDRCS